MLQHGLATSPIVASLPDLADAETVRALQGWLRGRELQCRVDGKWGPETKRALQTFLCRQSVDVGKAFHVVANGVFDARSRIALQVFLKCRNLYNGNIDGNFGEALRIADPAWPHGHHFCRC